MTGPIIRLLPLANLLRSETNPRKSFPPEYLAELSADVADKGIIQPLNVRIARGVFEDAEDPMYEIVCGECRWRAANMAGLPTAPCIIRDWTDQQVIEVQMVENLQRRDLSPMEECEGYHHALDMRTAEDAPAYTVETLAKKINKDPKHLYKMLQLRRLPDMARNALLTGHIGLGIAFLIARIPETEAREKAADRIIRPDFQDAPLSHRMATEMVQRDYMRDLKGAPFDLEDPTLSPLGPCGPCPHRAGNSPALFGDVKKGFVCTNPECYRTKVETTWQHAQEAAKTAGKRVLPAAESERLFGANGDLQWQSDFIDLASQPADDLVKSTTRRLTTWRQLLGTRTLPEQIVVARAPNGKVHELLPLQLALEGGRMARAELFKEIPNQGSAGTTAGTAKPAPQGSTAQSTREGGGKDGSAGLGGAADPSPREEKGRSAAEQTRIDLMVLERTFIWLTQKMAQAPMREDGWRALMPVVIAHAGPEAVTAVVARRELEGLRDLSDPFDAATELTLHESVLTIPALLAELLLVQYCRWQGGERSEYLAPLLKVYAIDVEEIRAGVEQEIKPVPTEGNKKGKSK